MLKNHPIGVVDSGVGGLTVLKTAQHNLPNEQFVYLGDTAHMPYGPQPAQDVIRYTQAMATFLIQRYAIKALIIACNTATVCALPVLTEELTIPVFGVIVPGAETAFAATRNQRIGLIATRGTVRSGAYAQALAITAARCGQPSPELIAQAEPEFVLAVEAGQAATPATAEHVRQQLAPLVAQQIDTLILGCTHFPLLREAIQAAVGQHVQLVDPSDATIAGVRHCLQTHVLLRTDTQEPHTRYLTTGEPAQMAQMANAWLQPREPITVSAVRVQTDGHLTQEDNL